MHNTYYYMLNLYYYNWCCSENLHKYHFTCVWLFPKKWIAGNVHFWFWRVLPNFQLSILFNNWHSHQPAIYMNACFTSPLYYFQILKICQHQRWKDISFCIYFIMSEVQHFFTFKNHLYIYLFLHQVVLFVFE
jgi:hypothetical protein